MVLISVTDICMVKTRTRHQEEFLGPLPSLNIDNDEFGRAARRGKVDLLGLTLKKRIEQIRLVGQAELVFLVDSSASVGSDNFYNEIKFIRKVNYLHFFAVKKK